MAIQVGGILLSSGYRLQKCDHATNYFAIAITTYRLSAGLDFSVKCLYLAHSDPVII